MMATQAANAARYFLVLPAAGIGQRMAATKPKQYLSLLGKTVLQHTLEHLAARPCFSQVLLALAPGDSYWPEVAAQLSAELLNKIIVVTGGDQRCDSVLNSLRSLQSVATAEDWVLVHDVVRPCVHFSDVERLMAVLQTEPAGGLLASPLRETLKRSTNEQQVVTTVDRQQLWCAATPQMFRYQVLRDALEQMQQNGIVVTDEAQAVELCGHPVKLVQGRADNIKLTFPEDLRLAELLLREAD
jgi:2-C-methyl-D-erythritol 4-phosphate cytidylyltransferase